MPTSGTEGDEPGLSRIAQEGGGVTVVAWAIVADRSFSLKSPEHVACRVFR
ncbi:hypothetical protein [Novosphingobium sp. ZW T3_23]|uniref:hypothetical protein n=1 Tax=Novosphingobium sp. ZW T3_23 TaxID=3378084 RepID=UPI003852792E